MTNERGRGPGYTLKSFLKLQQERFLASRLHATITIKGDADLLQACRARVNELLAEDFDEEFRELHTADRLEYEFRLHGGIPFPSFVMASQAFPEVTVEVAWTEVAQGRSGRAVIQNGTLREQASQTGAAGGPLLQDVRADSSGRLQLALACRSWRGVWHGYALAAEQHAFFRIEGDEHAFSLAASDGVEPEWAERWTRAGGETRYDRLAEREAIAEDELREIDAMAGEFAREWIWFAESAPEETAVERQRYEAYGVPVSAANIRSEKLREVLQPVTGGSAFSSFGEETRWIRELLARLWLEAGRSEEPPT
jgi:hypothetical protein